ncbi:hypothetical protein T10_10198 [Trichinella papuae]|uniref:Uncharacterized protein n=1 Tax=Trichinella papuae TaxID=268474 RepID=A0A0V1MF74_9BILA|nr:hypothetical protein T10_10198 [Trichinella papuae]
MKSERNGVFYSASCVTMMVLSMPVILSVGRDPLVDREQILSGSRKTLNYRLPENRYFCPVSHSDFLFSSELFFTVWSTSG